MGDSDSAPTIEHLLTQKSLKWIFVGGKGGVGKTTTSCSLAVQLTAVRESVLLISTDPAHNLSDAFRQKFTRYPTPVEGYTNLFAMEVDPTPEEDGVEAESADGGLGGGLIGELAGSIPGIDEAIVRHLKPVPVALFIQTLAYDVVVFDTAPTGHTLRLLALPSTLDKALGKILSLQNGIGGMVERMASMMGAGFGGDNPEESVFGKLRDLRGVVQKVHAQFQDASATTFVCVAIPEFLSLWETERLVQALATHGIDVNTLVVNQVLFPGPDDSASPLLAARLAMQKRYLDQFLDLYEDYHLVQLPLQSEEVRGPEDIRRFSKYLVVPYEPATGYVNPTDTLRERLASAEAEVAALKQRVKELESGKE